MVGAMASTIVGTRGACTSPMKTSVTCSCSGRTSRSPDTPESRNEWPRSDWHATIAARAAADSSTAVKRRAIAEQEPQHVHRSLGGLILHHVARSDELEG